MQTNLAFNVMVEHFTPNSTPSSKKDRRHYVNTLKLGPSLSAEKIKRPPPVARIPSPPPSTGFTLIGA